MNADEFIFKTLFVENKRDKYRYETYRVDKNRLKEFRKYLDKNIADKLNVNIDYNVNDIYTIFEKQKREDFTDIFDYLKYRDVFNYYTEWIEMLKKILTDLDINDFTYLAKNTNLGVCLDIKEYLSEKNQLESANVLTDVFSELGIIVKDKTIKNINPSFYKMFGIDKNNISKVDKSINIIKEKSDINFNDFFPGKSNGRIVRYLKIYKMIPNKENYDKNDFRKDLIDSGLVEIKKGEIYYIKDKLDELKDWISKKIII